MHRDIHGRPAPSLAVETDHMLCSFPMVPGMGVTLAPSPGVGSPAGFTELGAPRERGAVGSGSVCRGSRAEDRAGHLCPSHAGSPLRHPEVAVSLAGLHLPAPVSTSAPVDSSFPGSPWSLLPCVWLFASSLVTPSPTSSLCTFTL